MKFALVSWSKGKDKDALSVVPINGIVDFDPEDSNKEYLIECCSGKRPSNGWLVEPAHILQLAEKESTLKTAEQKLLQEGTPKSKKRKRGPNKFFLDTGGNCRTSWKKAQWTLQRHLRRRTGPLGRRIKDEAEWRISRRQ
ncbi:hypothetical protein PBY51_022945 [Eleginops maclovinus]|uniref:Uncharacterized protein n=1 Tax=Eleginops maclovinus TaxID=56733 RepID=A0AAN7XE25_ELEMC|nr:hypothetical protein PBY51_022945 [Eleginops maclovinus]